MYFGVQNLPSVMCQGKLIPTSVLTLPAFFSFFLWKTLYTKGEKNITHTRTHHTAATVKSLPFLFYRFPPQLLLLGSIIKRTADIIPLHHRSLEFFVCSFTSFNDAVTLRTHCDFLLVLSLGWRGCGAHRNTVCISPLLINQT